MDTSLVMTIWAVLPVNGLTTGRWVLQSYSTPSGGLQNPIAGTELTARFAADGSLTGSSGCNTYSSGFTAYNQTLRVGSLSVTSILCESPQGVMEQEELFLSLLRQLYRPVRMP